MAMGDLARLPRPDEYGESQDVPLDPWQRAAIAAQALEQSPPPLPSGPPPNMGSLYGMAGAGERAKSIGEGMARSADYYVGMPSRVMQGVPPETPGQLSEDDVARQDRLLAEQYGWAPSTALGMVFDPLGVKRSVGAGGVMLGSGAGSRIIQPTEGIRAYHSSPHDFEKFDFSPARARTGEGAQTYGEGGYFAENPTVSGRGGQYWQQFADNFAHTPTAEGMATRVLVETNADRAAAIAKLRDPEYQDFLRDPAMNSYAHYFKRVDPKEALRLLESGKPVGPRTYEVNIKARPDEMLNYDVPLKEQVPDVQVRLKDVMGPGGKWEYFKEVYPRYAIDKGVISNDRRAASMYMQEAGIPGIRYLDQGSRANLPAELADMRSTLAQYKRSGMPEGEIAALEARIKRGEETPLTSNYVMFPGTEDRVHIMAKYGLAGAVPTMGSLAQTGFSDRDQ